MKKQTLLLSALALSIGLSLSVLPPAAASLPTQVPGQGALPSLAPMLEKVLPAVVSVQVEGTASPTLNMPEELKKYFGDNAPQEQAQPFEGLGSGVIIDAAKGYVLTNNHVINQAQKISVQLNDGREFDAKLVGSDEQSDIALLQLIKPDHLTQIAIADSDKLRVGDFAVAVGNPFGLGQTATSGIISALGRSGLNLEGLENFIQTDASINRGNSGGALINEYGQVVGITSAKLSGNAFGSATVEGMGFAIPINTAKDIVDEIIQNGYVSGRPSIGITGRNVSSQDGSISGVQVYSIDSRAKAASEGLKVGDVITAVDGTPTPTMDEVNTVKADKKAGDKLTLSVYRISEDKTINLTITLTDAHDLEGDDPAETQQQNQSQNDNYGNYGNGYGSFGGFSSPFSSFGW